MRQSPTMLQKNLELAQAESIRYMNSAAMFPSVNSSFSYSINTSSPSESTGVKSQVDGIYYSVNIYQPIFHWGALKAQADSSKIGVKIAEKNFAEAYRNLALTIRSQFLELVVLKQKQRNADFALKVAQDSLRVNEDRLNRGRVSPGEIIPMRLAVEETELQRDQSVMEFESALKFMMHTAGLEGLSASEIPDGIPTADLAYDDQLLNRSLDRFLHVGVESTNTAQSLRSAIKQADLNYRIQKYRLFPKIGFGAGISQANSTYATASSVTQTGIYSENINLTVNWSIFDGFATKGAKKNALSAKRMSERSLADYVNAARLDADRKRRQLEFAYRGMRISEVRRDLALGALQQANDDLSRGRSSQGAVDAAMVRYNDSQLAAFINRAAFLNQAASLQSLIGIDPVVEQISTRFVGQPHR